MGTVNSCICVSSIIINFTNMICYSGFWFFTKNMMKNQKIDSFICTMQKKHIHTHKMTTNKTSTNKLNMKIWIEKGNNLPTCINNGCVGLVAVRHWSAQGDPSLKTECSKCANARKNNKIIKGVIFHKKNYCENKDGMLGFMCPVDNTRYVEFPSDIYHMDHLDGNHCNNTPENLKTFCAICHTIKGKQSGDFTHFFN